MPHVFEAAPSGRAKCRGCGEAIAKGELRFGERLPNPYGEGEMTLWFHPVCAMYKRPEPLLEALAAADAPLEDAERFEIGARHGLAHRRLPRLDGTERAPSGRARCRSCREPIPKDGWRISLVFYEEGRFEPGGFIHLGCAAEYFETADILDRVRHFSRLSEAELAEIARELESRPA
jgi:hypothetical protein